jgi:type II secretory pathway component PulC
MVAPGPSPTNLPGLAAYAAIVERPLFVPSRRPPPDVTSSIEGRYRLLGIVGAGAKRRAFVADGTRRIEVGEGDAIDGWTVKEIEQDRVLLTSPAGDAAALKLARAAPEPVKPEPGKPQ